MTVTEPERLMYSPVDGSYRWAPRAAVPEVATAPCVIDTVLAIADPFRGFSMPTRQADAARATGRDILVRADRAGLRRR